jgi:pantoate kinase
MKEAVAFSPAHLTGFFQILDQEMNPLQRGSRGAGFSIKKGVLTKVKVEKASETSFNIKVNGEDAKSARVSETVLQMFLSKVKENSYRVSISHEVAVPVGCGLGSSGAAALSLSLALNEVFSLGLSRLEVAQIAHLAEIACKTGLGTVIAETFGGFEIRVRAGAPGFGEVKSMPLNADYKMVFLSFGPLSTNKFLSDESFRRRINELGGEYVDKLVLQPSPELFMRLCRGFAEHVGLISERVRNVLNETDKLGVVCSMPMFGEAVFTLAKKDLVNTIVKVFRRHADSEQNVLVSEIDFEGARLLK